MRKPLGKLGEAIARPLLRAATLLLLISPTLCHAEGCPYQPTVSNVNPTTWKGGQTTKVTITGTNLDTAAAWVTEPNDASTITQGDPIVQTATELQIPFTVPASDPAETVTLVVDFVDGGCANEVPTQIQIEPGCTPTITSISPSTWFAGKTYNKVVITGTNFITSDKATAQCPVTAVTATTPDGSAVTVSNVNVVDKTKITATISPDANTTTEQATVTAGTAPNTSTPPTPAQILGNQIQCDPSMNCTQSVISTTDGSEPPVQSVVVGQQIHLTTPAMPSGISVKSSQWKVDGTRIANYSPTTASASVTEVTDDDLTNDEITYYWVYPEDDNIPVTYKYCANIPGLSDPDDCSLEAKAAFTVTGPQGGTMTFTPFAPAVTISNLSTCVDNTGATWQGGPWMYYATGVTGPACPGQANYPAFGINFNYPTGYANDSNGTYLLVQLISRDIITGEAAGASVAGLDGEYPYGLPPSSDSPKLYLKPTASSVRRDFTANMFLMWQSDTANSIPVPLGYQTWGFSGKATCSVACGAASSWKATTNGTPGPVENFTPSSASQTKKVGNNTLVDGYPTWTNPSD